MIFHSNEASFLHHFVYCSFPSGNGRGRGRHVDEGDEYTWHVANMSDISNVRGKLVSVVIEWTGGVPSQGDTCSLSANRVGPGQPHFCHGLQKVAMIRLSSTTLLFEDHAPSFCRVVIRFHYPDASNWILSTKWVTLERKRSFKIEPINRCKTKFPRFPFLLLALLWTLSCFLLDLCVLGWEWNLSLLFFCADLGWPIFSSFLLIISAYFLF